MVKQGDILRVGFQIAALGIFLFQMQNSVKTYLEGMFNFA